MLARSLEVSTMAGMIVIKSTSQADQKYTIYREAGESYLEAIMRELGWLVSGLMEKHGDFDLVCKQLNWEVVFE